jgi:hypothetical protein
LETLVEVAEAVRREILSTDEDIRAEFLRRYNKELEEFSLTTAECVLAWRSIDTGVHDEPRATISGLVHAAITLQTLSMKLLAAGQMVAAGNAFRQVLEASCTALLCSCPQLNVLSRFMQDQYSTSNAVRDVRRNWKALGIFEDAISPIEASQEFNHKYSHVTRLTLASFISLDPQKPGAYVGSAFDEAMLYAYQKEFSSRVGFSRIFPGLVAAVRHNLGKWK